MTNRLDEIRARFKKVKKRGAWHIRPSWRDIAYLLEEVDRLNALVGGLDKTEAQGN